MHSTVELERALLRLARTARRAGRRTADTLSPGLDESGYTLVVAADRLGATHACELADALGLDKSTVSRQLSALVERGLVERTADPDDGRAQVVSLSPDGRARLAASRTSHRADLAHAVADWSPAELEDAVRVLSRLSDGLAAAAHRHEAPEAHAHHHQQHHHATTQESRTA